MVAQSTPGASSPHGCQLIVAAAGAAVAMVGVTTAPATSVPVSSANKLRFRMVVPPFPSVTDNDAIHYARAHEPVARIGCSGEPALPFLSFCQRTPTW